MLWYSIFSFLDYAVYSIAAFLVRLIVIIANYDFFSPDVIKEVADKTYVVLGVLMLFKVVISAIQYMINPDTFDDKDKGMGGILKKIVICFLLLVLVRPIFSFAMYMQQSIVATIPAIILKSDKSFNIADSDASTRLEKIGNRVAGSTIRAFVTLKTVTPTDTSNKVAVEKMNKESYVDEMEDNLDSFMTHIKDGCEEGVLNGKSFTTEPCYYSYRIGLSTEAGIFLVYVLSSLTFDVAIRAIKLGIIQILAPIPISSYIVSKDKLGKFFKIAGSVYVDLFVRFGVIYFIIFFVEQIVISITDSVEINGGYVTTAFETAFVKVIIIVALFMFAKKAPKFICEVLGINSNGDDFKDMFKPAWQRAGLLGAAGGMVTAGVGNAINKAKFTDWSGSTKREKLKNAAKGIANVAGSGIAGAASAGFHGGLAALEGKNTKEVNMAGYKRAIKARQNRDLDVLNGVKWYDRAQTRAMNELGIDTKASLAENKQKAYSTLHQDVGAFKKAVMGRIDKNPSVAMRSDAKYNSAIHQLGQMLMDNQATINKGKNRDLKNILGKFTTTTDSQGRTVYTLKAGEHIGYYDLEAVRVNAEQEHIGSISGKIEPLKTIAQKEIFSDAMAGTVVDVSGNLMDEFNYGNDGYAAAGYTKGPDGIWRDAAGNERRQAHSDVTTAVQSAMQHITENGVPLGMDTTLLQKWFQGTVDASNPEDAKLLSQLPKDLQARIVGKDFGALDDEFQRRSEELSGQMSTSKEHLARASLERRNANKDKK